MQYNLLNSSSPNFFTILLILTNICGEKHDSKRRNLIIRPHFSKTCCKNNWSSFHHLRAEMSRIQKGRDLARREAVK